MPPFLFPARENVMDSQRPADSDRESISVNAARAATKQRELQNEIGKADANNGHGNGAQNGASQLGARRYPEPPFP